MKSDVQGRVVINLAKQRGSEDEDEDELVWWGDGGICKNVVCLSMWRDRHTTHFELYTDCFQKKIFFFVISSYLVVRVR